MKYRKKPVVIDAIQLTWDNLDRIVEFIDKKYLIRVVYVHDTDNGNVSDTELPNYSRCGIYIRTLEGDFLAVERDYIIKGVDGEFYPCKEDIFLKTYEPVE